MGGCELFFCLIVVILDMVLLLLLLDFGCFNLELLFIGWGVGEIRWNWRVVWIVCIKVVMVLVESGKGDVVFWGSNVGRRFKRLVVFRGFDMFEILSEDGKWKYSCER